MNMKERLARRLCVLNYGDPDEVMMDGSCAWTTYANDAEEVLDEMKKYTNGMRDELFYEFSSCAAIEDPQAACWDASYGYKIMIQAAIDGK